MKLNIEQIAEYAHELNRAWCDITGESGKPSWENVSEEIKQSSIHGVRHILSKSELPTPEEMWLEWKTYKLKSGWTKGIYSVNDKTHPNLLDEYDELSDIDKMKDRIFIEAVRVLSK